MGIGEGDRMGETTRGLPLGLVCSGFLLSVFTVIKSSISILLMAARAGSKDGFPFLFETVLVFPFTMQAIFYTSQTCVNLGFKSGLAAIKAASPFMGPCVFYACFITSTTLLETYSLQFIRPSTFVVLKQLTMVCIAIGEVLVFSMKPSNRAWMIIGFQVICVALFQYSSHLPSLQMPVIHIPSFILGGTPSVQVHKHPSMNLVETHTFLGMTLWAAGMTACLISVGTGACGSILMQRFMQKQAMHVPVSIKLLYQHVVELFLVMVVVQSRTEDRNRLWNNGFFGGWNHWTCIVTVTMWFAFLSGSAITANISSIAGAFAIAVSVALTGALECAIFGRSFSTMQFILMALVCMNAMFYTRERVAMLGSDNPEQKKLMEHTP
jgi:hypothetical protein